ncbi:DUF2599 domain-containing protein [Cellulomonas sp. NPDC089187]|uniref:DUF2599 domain-containing protein n=1 Tax=Cellulomonas sp. NPDC089187 TaxID=3154970 RepID=UPI0034428E75
MTRLPLVLIAGALLLGGCTTGTPAPAPTPTTSTSSAAPTSSTDAATIRATGTPLTVGDLTLHYLAGGSDLSPTTDEDGAITLEPTSDSALFAAPATTTPEALNDGSLLLRDSSGTPVAGIDVDSAQPTVGPDGLITIRATGPGAIHLTLATVAVRSVTWADIDDEGGRSLAVVPSDWARGGGLAVDALLWAQLIAAEPEADSQGMHDQLTCHQIGAPEKDRWNLEPWRPEVGLVETMLARCNPA